MTINPVWPFTKTVKKLASDNPVWSCIKYADKLISDNPVWSFTKQLDKLGYINNPNWTEEMADPKNHQPCGYWWVGPGCPIECGNWPRITPTPSPPSPPSPPPPLPPCIPRCTMFAPSTREYASGLDVVYINLPEETVLKRHLVHLQTIDSTSTMDVQIFDCDGQILKKIYSSNDYHCYPQCVKQIGDDIWFNYNGGINSGFYSIPWDETLASYPVPTGTVIANFVADYGWDIEERNDGKIFVSGIINAVEEWFWEPGESTPPPGIHDIQHWKIGGYGIPDVLIKILEVGGYSSGFAFDKNGNLWSGEYLLEWSPSMHIAPCRLGMWTKDQVDAVIAGGTFLTWEEASEIIPLGTTDVSGATTNWGPCDIGTDKNGDIYISLNTYTTWSHNEEYGRVVKLIYTAGLYSFLNIYTSFPSDNIWGWLRSLSYAGNIDEGCLYVDIDFDCGSYSMPDYVDGISIS